MRVTGAKTVIVALSRIVPIFAVMVTVPGWRPATVPSYVTAATAGLELIQDTATSRSSRPVESLTRAASRTEAPQRTTAESGVMERAATDGIGWNGSSQAARSRRATARTPFVSFSA